MATPYKAGKDTNIHLKERRRMNKNIIDDDDYIIKLFKKRCPHIKKDDVEEDKVEESEIDKIFKSDDGVKYDREDIFFSEFDEEENEDEYSDDEEEEDEKKDDGDKKDDKKKEKKINLLKFCKLSNPGLKGGKYTRTSYQDQFRTLFNNEYLSDVCFIAKGFQDKKEKKLFAHKLILKTRSDYFKRMFETPLKESKMDEIKIENVSYEILCVLIEYLYTGVLNVTYQNALLILAAANQFMMQDVKEIISEYFKEVIDSDIACMLYEESFFHNTKELRKLCLSYIESNSNKVVFSDAFKQMTTDMVKEIIRSDYLSVDEFKLFNGLIEWAKAQAAIDRTDKTDYKKYLDKVIEFIRFPLMKPVDLRDKIEKKYPNLIPKKYVMEAYRYHTIGNVSSPRTRPRLSLLDFKWDQFKKSSYVSLDSTKCIASTTYTANRAISCCADKEMKEGLYYWEVKIENTPATKSDIMVGVVDKSCVNTENFLAYNSRGWAIFGNGQKYWNSRSYPYTSALQKDDIIGVLLNLTEKTLSFYLNGKSLGVAFKGVTGPVSPAFSLFAPGDRISLKTGVRPTKEKESSK